MDNTNSNVPNAGQIKLVPSKTTNIRIQDRKTFGSRDKDKELLHKLKSSHEQRKKIDDLKLKIKIKPPFKQNTNCYDEKKVKRIVATMDSELLALIFMNAEPAKVIDGLKKLSEKSANGD